MNAVERCLLIIGAVAAWMWLAAPGALAGSDADLVQTDAAMNQDIMGQGNDIHAMRAFMSEQDMAYSSRVHGFVNLHELYKKAPTLTNPENVIALQTEYVAVSAAGDLGITYGLWNSAEIGDKPLPPTAFYRGFVFGLRAGLWTAKWSPRGAPRHFYFRYIRIWRRAGPGAPWRLAAGPFVARTDELADTSVIADATVAVQPLTARTGFDAPAAAAAARTDIDAGFPDMLRKDGIRTAYRRYALGSLRVMYEDRGQVSSMQQFLAEEREPDLKLELAPVGKLAAASEDLRCDYGFQYRIDDVKHQHPMLYADVWQYQAGAWKLIFSYMLRPVG